MRFPAGKKIIGVDVTNLSVSPDKWVRTGIQEVIYQVLCEGHKLRSRYPDAHFIFLPFLTRRFGGLMDGILAMPYPNNPVPILKRVEEDFGLSSAEIWGFDLKSYGYELTHEQINEILMACDHIHIQALLNIDPMISELRAMGARATVSATLYDVVPKAFPEYCDNSLARWFVNDYLPGLAKHCRELICISRYTAIVAQSDSHLKDVPSIRYLQLAAEIRGIPKHLPELEGKNYLVFLGSLEPRKNFEAVLRGFTKFMELNPQSDLNLVLVGGTGWKNFRIDHQIQTSPWLNRIIRTGYLDDPTLKGVVERSAGVIMLAQYEGFGLPVAQAKELGAPIITWLGSSLPDAARGRGIFVEPFDPISVAAGIRIALGQNRKNSETSKEFDWKWADYSQHLLDWIYASTVDKS